MSQFNLLDPSTIAMALFFMAVSILKSLGTLGTLILVPLNLYDLWRGSRFIASVLPNSEPIPSSLLTRVRRCLRRCSAAGTLLRIYLRHPWLFVSYSENRFLAARLYVEIQILEAMEPPPNPNDYIVKTQEGSCLVGGDWNEEMRTWEAKKRETDKRIARLLREQLDERKATYLTKVIQLLQGLYRYVMRSMFGRTVANGLDDQSLEPNHILIDSIKKLDDRRDLIKRYFGVLGLMGDNSHTFAATIRIESGFLAPLFLITGLLNRFGEDEGWGRIINNYPALTGRDADYSRSLIELRSFLFNCWLLWGPSIPTCNCSLWQQTGNPDNITLQYGYGDENNSLDLLIRGWRGSNLSDGFKLRLSYDAAKNVPRVLCAAPYNITGKLRWGPSIPATEVSEVQGMVRGGWGEYQDPNQGRVVLEADANSCQPRDDNAGLSQYYSAYLWVMFEIVDRETHRPFHEAMAWKNLLTFFEHGNIADAATFQSLKENLVAKICSSLVEILGRPEDSDKIAVRYVCAFDDSNCGMSGSGLAFPPAAVVGEKRTRLVDILHERIGRDTALTAARGERLLLPGDAEGAGFGACHLPKLVESFYEDLAVEAARKRPAESPGASP